MELDVLPRVYDDVADHAFFLEQHSPSAARRFLAEVRLRFQMIAAMPFVWPVFSLTGPPYRASLFRASPRTTFWIVYLIDEPAGRVSILRVWNSARDPAKFHLPRR